MNPDNPDSSSQNSKNALINLLSNPFKKKQNGVFNSKDYQKLDTPRQEMIKGVLNLHNQNARDIMIPRVDIKAIDCNTDFKALVKFIYEEGHSRLPVFEDTIDNIIGIIYAKDLLKSLIETSRKKFQIKKHIHTPYFVPETMPLDELLLEFKKRKLHLAIVVDEYGGIAGIVTLEDILEEIVGEIQDEFDSEELPEWEKTGTNQYEVDSRMPLTDFNEALNLTLPEESFDTIGGYVFNLFGKIPKKNEEVTEEHITFKIKSITGTVINRIIIKINKKKK